MQWEVKCNYQICYVQQSKNMTTIIILKIKINSHSIFGYQGTIKSINEVIDPPSNNKLMPKYNGHESRRRNISGHTMEFNNYVFKNDIWIGRDTPLKIKMSGRASTRRRNAVNMLPRSQYSLKVVILINAAFI